MRYSTTISIDPGASGAAVVRSADGPIEGVVNFEGIESVRLVMSLASRSPAPPSSVGVVIERVWASPVMGVSSSFAFGENYGIWHGALRAAGFHVHTVTPQVWQKASAPHIAGQGDARKRALRDHAKATFDLPVGESLLPAGTRITLDNCDALLISVYAERQNRLGAPLGTRI